MKSDFYLAAGAVLPILVIGQLVTTAVVELPPLIRESADRRPWLIPGAQTLVIDRARAALDAWNARVAAASMAESPGEA